MDLKKLFDLAELILIIRGGPTSGNWAHDGRPGKLGGSGRGGGFGRLRVATGTTSREDVVGISRRVRKKRKQLKDKGVLPKEKPNKEKPTKKVDKPIKTKPGSGKKVSEGVDLGKVPKSGKVGPPIRDTLDIINSVHSDGDLTKIPVRIASPRATFGHYKYNYRQEPVEVMISRKGIHPHMTMAHEMGHFIDHQGVGKKGVFSSRTGSTDDTDAGRRLNKKLDGLYNTIGESKAIRALRNDVPNQVVKVEYGSGGGTWDYKADRNFIRYLLEPREQFARAYSQYIATKSKNPAMMKELNDTRDRKNKKIYYHDQWDDDDFKPISKAFDDLFGELGWIEGE